MGSKLFCKTSALVLDSVRMSVGFGGGWLGVSGKAAANVF